MGDETQPPSDVANGAFLSTRMAPRRPGKSWPIMQTLCTVVALPIYRNRLRAVRLHLLASVIGSISHFTDQPSPVNSAPGFSTYPLPSLRSEEHTPELQSLLRITRVPS